MASVLVTPTAKAQVSLHVNIGAQPAWGPVGYDYVNYYYLPDIEAYYDVPARQFIYLDGGRWISAAYLPPRFRNYDLYHGYKVVINDPRPWMRFNDHRVRYAAYCHRFDQPFIRDSRDPRYYRDYDDRGWGNNGRGRGMGHRKWDKDRRWNDDDRRWNDDDRGWNDDRRGNDDWKRDRRGW